MWVFYLGEGLVGDHNFRLLLGDQAAVTVFVQFVQERPQVPRVKLAVEYVFQLSQRWVLDELNIVVQMKENTSC